MIPRVDETIAYFADRRDELARATMEFVSWESPSDDPTALTDCAKRLVAHLWSATGLRPELVDDGTGGPPHVRLDLGESPEILLLGHFDTVHPVGSLERVGSYVEGGRIYGPGALDMKGGVAVLVEVARYLVEEVGSPPVTLFFSSDEELASPRSGPKLRELAASARMGFIAEPTGGRGIVKRAARGFRHVLFTARGLGGHAAYPEACVNPVPIVADFLRHLEDVAPRHESVSMMPTMLSGANAANVVPEFATVEVDMRAATDAALDAAEVDVMTFRPTDERVQVSIERHNAAAAFPLRENNQAFAVTVEAAQEIMMEPFEGIVARGGSDANQIAPILPHLVEGFGGWGAGAHSLGREYVEVASLAESTMLLARAVLRGLSTNA